MENRAVAKPGLNVNILFTLDIDKETADVRGAMIYDVIGEKIILSQTNPPIKERHLGKDISITYLIGENTIPLAMVFAGKWSASSKTTICLRQKRFLQFK